MMRLNTPVIMWAKPSIELTLVPAAETARADGRGQGCRARFMRCARAPASGWPRGGASFCCHNAALPHRFPRGSSGAMIARSPCVGRIAPSAPASAIRCVLVLRRCALAARAVAGRGVGAGRVPARHRHSPVVHRVVPRLSRRGPRRDARRTPADDLFRPGRLPVLHGADGDQFFPARHRREDPPAFRRDRAQHLGRPRDDLDRRAHDERKGAGAATQRAVHADAALLRRARRGRGAAQRLLSAAPVRGGARLRGRQARAEGVARRLSRRDMSAIRPVRASPTSRSSCRRRTIFGAAPAASRSRCCSRPLIAARATKCIARACSVRRCARC